MGATQESRQHHGRLMADIVEWISCAAVRACIEGYHNRATELAFPPAVVSAQLRELQFCIRVVATVVLHGGLGFGFVRPVSDGDGFNVHIRYVLGVYDDQDSPVWDSAVRHFMAHKVPVVPLPRDPEAAVQPRIDGDVLRLRLLGADAAEVLGTTGEENLAAERATAFLRTWTSQPHHARLVIDIFDLDKYGRALVIIRAGMPASHLAPTLPTLQSGGGVPDRFSVLIPDMMRAGHLVPVPHFVQVRSCMGGVSYFVGQNTVCVTCTEIILTAETLQVDAWTAATLAADTPAHSMRLPMQQRMADRNAGVAETRAHIGKVVRSNTLGKEAPLGDYQDRIRDIAGSADLSKANSIFR